MNLIEIVPRNSRAHRRMIREMTREPFWKGHMPMNPIAAAMLEIACAAAAGVMIALVIRLLVWRLCGL